MVCAGIMLTVLAVAYRAKSVAPIGMKLVKDVLRLVNGIG